MIVEQSVSSGIEPSAVDSWNLCIGSVWAAIFESSSLAHDGVVVEIGPGFTDKVGLALARRRFRGTLYVVEPNEQARSWVVGRYRELVAAAEVIAVATPLATAGSLLPHRVDGLLMNHLLDDLVLGAALPSHTRERLFQRIRPGQTECLPEIHQTWQRLLGAPSMLHDLEQRVLGDLQQVIEVTNPRLFGASQYPSWFLLNNGLGAVDRRGALLLDRLAQRMGRTPERLQRLLRELDQAPERWLVLER